MGIFFTRSTPVPSSMERASPSLSVGEELFPRWLIHDYVSSLPSGRILGAIFTALKTEGINSLRLMTGTTAAAATPSLCRVGVWEWDDIADQGALIASSVNDTSLFSTTITEWDVPLSTTFNKVAGVRYALGVLVVSSVATPDWQGYSRPSNVPVGTTLQRSPRMLTRADGLSDLPDPFVGSTPAGAGYSIYWAMVP